MKTCRAVRDMFIFFTIVSYLHYSKVVPVFELAILSNFPNKALINQCELYATHYIIGYQFVVTCSYHYVPTNTIIFRKILIRQWVLITFMHSLIRKEQREFRIIREELNQCELLFTFLEIKQWVSYSKPHVC